MIREVDWLARDRRFPGELRLPDVACIIRVETSARLADRPIRHALLHLIGPSHRQTGGRGRSRTLGDREPPALSAMLIDARVRKGDRDEKV